MRILAIETSCDETAIAIIDAETSEAGSTTGSTSVFHVLANVTLSQIALHREYGGVFPMLAKREHARTLVPILTQALGEAGLRNEKMSRHVIEHPLREEFREMLDREPELFSQMMAHVPDLGIPRIDAIAVTTGPGLEPALWVGLNFARALALLWKLPLISINHMEGHLLAAALIPADDARDGRVIQLAPIAFPAIALLVSGGHTEIVRADGWGSYDVIGQTRDDAVGEAFDKAARLLGLPYPGGPEIAKLAKEGTPGTYPLPRPMLRSDDYDFSFSGLKTAVRYLVRDLGTISETQRADIAREFEDACVEVLVSKTIRAARDTAAQTILLGGGVSANTRLREALARLAKNDGIPFFAPERDLSTDNALMIAISAYLRRDETADLKSLRAHGTLPL